VPAVAAEVEATSVHAAADAGPYGRQRDAALARFFLQHLVDGDLASNHHGWQAVRAS
jgi:deoxyribodipyrimidine photolyase